MRKQLLSSFVLLSLAGCPADGPSQGAETGDEAEATGEGSSTSFGTGSPGSAGPSGTTDTPPTDPSTSSTGEASSSSGSSGGDETTGGQSSDGMCDPAGQDCPQGEKCTAYREAAVGCCTDANKCVPVIGSGQSGDSCWREDDNDDCDVGLFCWTTPITGTGAGVCHSFCDTDASEACDAGFNCKSFNEGTLPMCVKECDPLAPVCPSTQGCYLLFENEFSCANNVSAEGGGADGDSCFAVNSCQPGNACVFQEMKPGCESVRCCTVFCDVTDVSPCGVDEECVPVFEEGQAPPGYGDVGVCGTPQ